MAGSFACLYYHIVFSTRDRRPHITPDIAPALYGYMAGVIKGIDGVPIQIGGMRDHTHVLTSLCKDRAMSEQVRDIKSNASRWVHGTYPALRSFAWQEGYGAFTVSVSGLDKVKAYILAQEEHHRTVTFQDELISFLERHGIAYNPEYIWR